MNEKWLATAKAGDEVYVCQGGGWSRHMELRTVERVTETQVIVAGTKYRRRDGRVVGDTRWSSRYLVEPTPELRADISEERRRQELLARIRDVTWRDIETDVLARIIAVLEASQTAAAVDPVVPLTTAG